MDNTLLKRISTNSAILCGKPVLRGMRISVEQITMMLLRKIPVTAIIDEYPMLEEEDINACILFAFNENLKK